MSDLQKTPGLLEDRIKLVASREPEGNVYRLPPLTIPDHFRVPRAGPGDVLDHLRYSAVSAGSGATLDRNGPVPHNGQSEDGSAPTSREGKAPKGE